MGAAVRPTLPHDLVADDRAANGSDRRANRTANRRSSHAADGGSGQCAARLRLRVYGK